MLKSKLPDPKLQEPLAKDGRSVSKDSSDIPLKRDLYIKFASQQKVMIELDSGVRMRLTMISCLTVPRSGYGYLNC